MGAEARRTPATVSSFPYYFANVFLAGKHLIFFFAGGPLRLLMFACVESTLDGAVMPFQFAVLLQTFALPMQAQDCKDCIAVVKAKWSRARRSYRLVTPGNDLDRERRESFEARATPVDSRTTSSGLNMYSSPALVRFFAPARIASNIL
jgi:hypothetical protein